MFLLRLLHLLLPSLLLLPLLLLVFGLFFWEGQVNLYFHGFDLFFWHFSLCSLFFFVLLLLFLPPFSFSKSSFRLLACLTWLQIPCPLVCLDFSAWMHSFVLSFFVRHFTPAHDIPDFSIISTLFRQNPFHSCRASAIPLHCIPLQSIHTPIVIPIFICSIVHPSIHAFSLSLSCHYSVVLFLPSFALAFFLSLFLLSWSLSFYRSVFLRFYLSFYRSIRCSLCLSHLISCYLISYHTLLASFLHACLPAYLPCFIHP